MIAPSDQEPWSQEDMLTLLESMKTLIPANDNSKYKFRVSRLDWDKVAFKNYTGSMCRQQWSEIARKIRTFRTLTELILDTEEYVKNCDKEKKAKKVTQVPRKPLSPYLHFFVEQKPQYEKEHPEMSHIDLCMTLSQKYKELPEEEKVKYIEASQKETHEYVCYLAKVSEKPDPECPAGSAKRKRHRVRKRKTNVPATTFEGYIDNKIARNDEASP